MADAVLERPATGAGQGAAGAGPGAGVAQGDAELHAAEERVWARVLAARDQRRPHTLELLEAMATDVT